MAILGQVPLKPSAAAAIFRSLTGSEFQKVMIVCAHPDDECVGAGVVLPVLSSLTVVHVTGGVPDDPRYARWAGFKSLEAYKSARLKEAQDAMNYMGLSPTNLLNLGFNDQQLSYQLEALANSIVALIGEHEPDIVITHPYEGGHPDHDAVAFSCHHALMVLKRLGKTLPHLVEMTSYFSSGGERVLGEFAQDNYEGMSIMFDQDSRTYKKGLYQCYASQLELLKTFPLEVERFRLAPCYDFTQPPEVPEILYDKYELGIKSRQWLELSRSASERLCAEESSQRVLRTERPEVGKVAFGDLARVEPISRWFGYDRGTPIDRPFIEQFLHQHRQDIRGRVLEIGDDSYTRKFGDDRVSHRDVLHVKEGALGSTIIGDLSHAPQIPDNTFDCLILTQVLVCIFDLPSTITTIYRILKPGGVVLVTVPGISNIDKGEWHDYWMWSFSPNALRKLLMLKFPPHDIEVTSRGNVFSAISFLEGLCTEDLQDFPEADDDPHYPLTVLGRAVKPLHVN
ncbi:bifunctional PIG-L family deacetylase/class I SAM-dependent methyltransferase [Cyanobium sp. ATX 6A2]|uniref:bifunctional PIG-L family deacetylase/class I SAM-dependent methyltransferase n=1 Tax=Cyanobium sp. ATX 6A2 TaxID=2823700 RepID=UPI0020CD1562|nr:bifunctional PIG-L family deacetylase/class I SAM-dependent methyltransferase [Cyanobium sp. ATX 6A2]MCP9889430.1 bifunctional PIG-L family deacetylase/class I SAM-dependent methyltransferase [Cyanobium sp. ATX 6A2]